MLEPRAFFQKLLPYARVVRRVLGAPEAATLIHWAFESGFESPKWIGHNNYAGLTNAGETTGFREYVSIWAFVASYCRTLVLVDETGAAYYAEYLEACRRGAPIEECLLALARSPWDLRHYGGDGRNIVACFRTHRGALEEILGAIQEAPPVAAGDVADYAAAAATWVVAAGISDGSRPGEPATREEVWTMLHRAAGRPALTGRLGEIFPGAFT